MSRVYKCYSFSNLKQMNQRKLPVCFLFMKFVFYAVLHRKKTMLPSLKPLIWLRWGRGLEQIRFRVPKLERKGWPRKLVSRAEMGTWVNFPILGVLPPGFGVRNSQFLPVRNSILFLPKFNPFWKTNPFSPGFLLSLDFQTKNFGTVPFG